MSANIVLNKSNIVNLNKGNNRLSYIFPRDVIFNQNAEIALSGLHLYYSWFNITKANNNNFFQYKWFNNNNGDVDVIVDVTIPDGYYSIQTLYEYFQKVMVENGHYLELQTGNYIYFIEFLVNSTYYASEIRLSTISTTYDFGTGPEDITTDEIIKPPSGWKIPSSFKAPEIIIPSNNKFGELLGFNPQTLQVPDENKQYMYSFLNDIPPNIEPQNSYIITCNLVDNHLSIPNNVLYSFTLPDTEFGSSLSPVNEALYSKIKPGKYHQLNIQILDQNYNPLHILDPNMLVLLTIKMGKNEIEEEK